MWWGRPRRHDGSRHGGFAGALCDAALKKNPMAGKKLLITGKGRCNVTTACDRERFFEHVARNPKFLYAAFAAFDNRDAMTFLKSWACR